MPMIATVTRTLCLTYGKATYCPERMEIRVIKALVEGGRRALAVMYLRDMYPNMTLSEGVAMVNAIVDLPASDYQNF